MWKRLEGLLDESSKVFLVRLKGYDGVNAGVGTVIRSDLFVEVELTEAGRGERLSREET